MPPVTVGSSILLQRMFSSEAVVISAEAQGQAVVHQVRV